MPKFIIEREIPGAGKRSAEQLHGIAQKSCQVLNAMKGAVQWQESYVTDDSPIGLRFLGMSNDIS
jgi:hypothetical protein